MEVTFIQYLSPDGRQKRVQIDRPEAVARKARAIWEAGYALEVEVLSTGEVSLSIGNGEEDRAIELCANGPEVPLAVDRLILEFIL